MRRIVALLLVIISIFACVIPAFAEKESSDVSDWHPFDSTTKTPTTLPRSGNTEKSLLGFKVDSNIIFFLLLFIPPLIILFVAKWSGSNTKKLRVFLNKANKYYTDEKVHNANKVFTRGFSSRRRS